MRTTKKITLLAVLFFMQMLFIQCSKNENSAAAPAPAPAAAPAATPVAATDFTGIKIAYVDYDSLLAGYNFAQDIQKELIRKEMSINNTIEEQRKNLQDEATEFERKIQNNVFATQERAQAEYDKIMKKEQELMQRGQAMVAELEQIRAEKFEELTKNIETYIQGYNSTRGYDFILTKVGSNMLYANKALNITGEVINGLNEEYKSKK